MRRQIFIFYFLFFLFSFLCGCTQVKQLAHLDQLLTLKAIGENHDAQTKFINEHDKKFEQLLAAVKADQLKEYPDKKSILKSFGEPTAVTRPALDGGQSQEQWVYRYALISKAKDKVYLYFDDRGKFIRYEKEQIQWK